MGERCEHGIKKKFNCPDCWTEEYASKSALSDGLDIKKYVRCRACDSDWFFGDVDRLPLSKEPGHRLDKCQFQCPACGYKGSSFIFFDD